MAASFVPKDSYTPLGSLIARQITESSLDRITFAEYMDLALYQPLYGYYAGNATRIGVSGDFFTSPHLGVDFGELLAGQFVQMWQLLGCPVPFTLVEMGAGQGLLASDVLRYLQKQAPELFSSLEYVIVERAAAFIAAQQRQLSEFQMMGAWLRWCDLSDIANDSITGCFFSNELVDALPVHQVVVENRQLREVFVTLQPDAGETVHFAEVIGDLSTPELATYFDLNGIKLLSDRYANGYRTEVNLAALSWISTVAAKLHQGYVLTIDYGYEADRYYHPLRSQGTLQCYYQHAHHSDPYIYVGQQDITAHVDFTALQRQGDRCGLQTLGFTKQGLFLMALGLGDRLAAISQSDTTEPQEVVNKLRQRDALQQLIDPAGLGNFGVLIQRKGLSATQKQQLRGLQEPSW